MYSAKIAGMLERRGWTREVAGETDFGAAVAAVETMCQTGLGLIVAGEYGVGKSALANVLAHAFGRVYAVRLALPEDLEHLTREWQQFMAEDPFAQNVWLDDLGAEATTNEYGSRFERAGDFIVAWHALHAAKTRLFITTNLTTEELDARYGGRVLSRLKDLCIPLRLNGGDKRRWHLADTTEGGRV